MTRPGGPAEPPGLTEGQRIVREEAGESALELPIWQRVQQRIDAALAEAVEDTKHSIHHIACPVPKGPCNCETLWIEHGRLKERIAQRAALAERASCVKCGGSITSQTPMLHLPCAKPERAWVEQCEAQITALREALLQLHDAAVERLADPMWLPAIRANAVRINTADAAARCVERAKTEEREECAKLLDRMEVQATRECCSEMASEGADAIRARSG